MHFPANGVCRRSCVKYPSGRLSVYAWTGPQYTHNAASCFHPKTAATARMLPEGQTAACLSQASVGMSHPSQRYKGSSWQKNSRSFIQPLHFTITQDAWLQNEEPIRRSNTVRFGRRKAALPVEPYFIKRKAPAGEQAQTLEKIHIKTLDEIRREKAARSQQQGLAHEAGTRGTMAPSPVQRSAKPPGAVYMKTSEVLQGRKRKMAREGEEELMGRSEASPEGEVLAKKAAIQLSEIRVKTLEEIRMEKAARMQARAQEVRAEEAPVPPSAQLKRRILRINRSTATGADSGGQTTISASEASIYGSPSAEQSCTSTEPLLSHAKDPPAAPQSITLVKTPSQPKSFRQSMATPHTSGSSLDELDEFTNYLLDGVMELDPAMDVDHLCLELLEMIGNS